MTADRAVLREQIEAAVSPVAWALYGKPTGFLRYVERDESVVDEYREFYTVAPLVSLDAVMPFVTDALAAVEAERDEARALLAETSADCADAEARSANAEETSAMIAALSAWIDGSYPPEMLGTEVHERRRIDKLMEEVGEVGQALGGVWAENPRKGQTHSPSDVDSELLDVIVTAAGAWESRNGNQGTVGAALHEHMTNLLARVGLAAYREETGRAPEWSDPKPWRDRYTGARFERQNALTLAYEYRPRTREQYDDEKAQR